MNASIPIHAKAASLHNLHGRSVLVRSSRDRRNPPTAMRGWIDVRETPPDGLQVSVVVQFPQMFTTPAHQRTLLLDEAALTRLLQSERNDTFEFTIDEEWV